MKEDIVPKVIGFDEAELILAMDEFYSPEQQQAALLEVFTDAEVNVRMFRELFKQVKN